jgi:hypothetical protein
MEVRKEKKTAWGGLVSILPPAIKRRLASLKKRIAGASKE